MLAKKIDIRFVDLHYKGVKIQREWKHIVRNTAVVLWLVFFLVFLVRFGVLGISGGFLTDRGWIQKLLIQMVIPAALTAGILLLFVVCIFLPAWNYLSDLQRLCEIIYTYPLYLVRNYIGEEGLNSDSGGMSVKREIEYFPSFYYRIKQGIVEITVRLDGSKFHENGSFENLTKVLEDFYTLNVVDMTQRKEYLTYHLFRDAEKNRIQITQVIPKKYTIPLMKGIGWEINKVPHALVVGGTGGGKSYFLNVLIYAFIQMGAELYICDPKNSVLADYRLVLPHVESDTEGIMKCVVECVDVMETRYKEIKKDRHYVSGQDFTHYHLPPVVLILDEYAAYASSLQRKEKEEFKSALNQLVLKGREAGVFVVLATQRPDAEYLNGNVRDQLGLRVTLGQMSDEGYRMAFGSTQQKLKNAGKRGHGYLYMDNLTFIQKFCAPYVPPGYRFIEEAGKLLEMQKEGNKIGRKDSNSC